MGKWSRPNPIGRRVRAKSERPPHRAQPARLPDGRTVRRGADAGPCGSRLVSRRHAAGRGPARSRNTRSAAGRHAGSQCRTSDPRRGSGRNPKRRTQRDERRGRSPRRRPRRGGRDLDRTRDRIGGAGGGAHRIDPSDLDQLSGRSKCRGFGFRAGIGPARARRATRADRIDPVRRSDVRAYEDAARSNRPLRFGAAVPLRRPGHRSRTHRRAAASRTRRCDPPHRRR